MFEPDARLILSKFINIDSKEHRSEPEQPKSQEKHVIAKHYYEQDENCIIIFLYLYLHKKHPAKQCVDSGILGLDVYLIEPRVYKWIKSS